MDQYFVNDFSICMNGKDGAIQLTNFDAWIQKQLIYHDAHKTTTVLELAGRMGCEGEKLLPPIQVSANDFASMSWVNDQWGIEPVIFPHPSAERNLRTAIQLKSKPTVEHIYTHIGWTTIDKRRTYLTSSGGIHAKGMDAELTVQLPQELSHYALPKPKPDKAAFAASVTLPKIGPPRVMVPLLLAAYRAVIGPCDFAIHLAGRTGTFKSEVTSLIQSHFGDRMDARHLPGSWSSTPNAIEHLAYRAANAVLTVDDFVPMGTSYQVRQLQAAADKIIRAQGNQAGRARLTDISTLQTTYYPRGIIISTGEDIPEGHSVRGRMMIVELSPGEIDVKALSKAQAARSLLPVAMADWVQWNAAKDRLEELKKVSKRVRDEHQGIGHSRTPSIIGELVATVELLAIFAQERKYLTPKAAIGMVDNATKAILEVAGMQKTYHEAADPVEAMKEAIRTSFSSQVAHVKTRNGGIPSDPVRYGWTEQTAAGQLAEYRANGPRIGWIDLEHNELLIDPGSMTFLKKYSNGRMSVTPQTLIKRVKEAGLLTRTEEHKSRNTVRVTCEGHSRYVLALNHDEVMEE